MESLFDNFEHGFINAQLCSRIIIIIIKIY